jgi:Acyl-protein synthetase, LuxE
LLDAGATTFDELALRVFHHQYHHTAIYKDYCDIIGRTPQYVKDITDIPFLPINFFKTHSVLSGSYTGAALTFESSGTTGEVPSRHFVADAAIYERSLLQGFQQFYGSVQQYAILALLPSYLERKNASLVHMARTLMAHSGHPANGFYINEWDKLHDTLAHLEQNGQQTLLLGVTFALLDFAAAHPMHLRHTIVMETGGMKGRREELTRTEVHDILKQQFGLQQVHSEYGMTELLSQAYATSSGIFRCTNTMKVLVRDINDPLDVARHGTGAINVIDLANIHSCSFIATEDMARLTPDGTFEVLGRLDHSALRGCSLMVV